jgi:predicted nucleic acid-binding protein
MTAIIDVSAVTDILLHGPKMHKYNDILQEASLTLAPDLYVSELSNTFWKYRIAKKLTDEECVQHINDGLGYVDPLVDSKELWQEAFQAALNNKHSVYDMFYLVTARRYSGTLITNDGPLVAICEKLQIQYCY